MMPYMQPGRITHVETKTGPDGRHDM